MSDLKNLERTIIKLKQLFVTKSVTLAYEHIENKRFLYVGIPMTEPIDSKDRKCKASKISKKIMLKVLLFYFVIKRFRKEKQLLRFKE